MNYLRLTLRHKWYVFLACLEMRVPLWRALIHDWSKFTPAELPHYDRQFFGDKGDPRGFARAWLHHQNHNPHHWEHWITRSDHSHGESDAVNGCLAMPETYVREMIADWMGASRAYTGSWDMSQWLEENLPRMKLHPDTREKVTELLWVSGYRYPMTWLERINVEAV